jgi:predicted transcriptional regulator
MAGVDLGHHGARCTAEVLAERFRPMDMALRAVAEVVHDLDLKDEGFGRPEAPVCKTEGTTIKELIEKTELSDKKIRNTLVQFLEVGYISEGASIGKAKTFMLTKEGFIELNSLRKNIFGEV